MAKKPARRATRALPSPPTGQPKPTGNHGYPPPQTGGYTLGLHTTTHSGSNYPQPNSATDPDPASAAPPGPVPSNDAYQPSLAGNTLSPSVTPPGLQSGKQPPNLPS